MCVWNRLKYVFYGVIVGVNSLFISVVFGVGGFVWKLMEGVE